MTKARFETLDALRGVAALCVLMFHLRLWLPDMPFFRGGYLAVDMFFVLSGFVIEGAYGRRLVGDMSFREFAKVRVIRLWPMYLVGAGLAFGLNFAAALSGNLPWLHLVGMSALSLVLLPWRSPLSDALFLNNTPAWSLFAEMAANLAYAAFRRFCTDPVLLVIVGLSAGALIWIAPQAGQLDGGVTWSEWPALIARVGFSFPLGLLLYRHKGKLDRLPSLPFGVPMAATALLLAAPAAPRWPFDLFFILLLSPVLVSLGVRAHGSNKWTRRLGDISYPLYAIHVPIRGYAEAFAKLTGAPLPLLAVPYILGCVLAAAALFHWYDKPIRKWLSAGKTVAPPPEPQPVKS